MMDRKVLIVGAGPTGLVLAVWLPARGGGGAVAGAKTPAGAGAARAGDNVAGAGRTGADAGVLPAGWARGRGGAGGRQGRRGEPVGRRFQGGAAAAGGEPARAHPL